MRSEGGQHKYDSGAFSLIAKVTQAKDDSPFVLGQDVNAIEKVNPDDNDGR